MTHTCTKCGHILKKNNIRLTAAAILLSVIFGILVISPAHWIIPVLYLFFAAAPILAFLILKKQKMVYFCTQCSSTFSEEDLKD
ncbi:MAG: hypothetical protein D3926_14535 [Desulfobacteraceae bacterium]|nr:MAG: hypothetical protein D3926_14535 [Desulfobacteraceae bacterium]